MPSNGRKRKAGALSGIFSFAAPPTKRWTRRIRHSLQNNASRSPLLGLPAAAGSVVRAVLPEIGRWAGIGRRRRRGAVVLPTTLPPGAFAARGAGGNAPVIQGIATAAATGTSDTIVNTSDATYEPRGVDSVEKENEPVQFFHQQLEAEEGFLSGPSGYESEEDASAENSGGDGESEEGPTRCQIMEFNRAVEVCVSQYFYDVIASAFDTEEEKYKFLKEQRNRLKLGPWQIFEERTREALAFFCALQNGKAVPGHFGNFTEEAAKPIALRKVRRLLEAFAAEIGRSVTEILGGLDLEAFLDRYNSLSGLRALKKLAMERAVALWDGIVLEEGETTGLVRSIIGVYPGKDGEDKLWMSLAALMIVQHCVGSGTVMQGYDPGEFERLVASSGSFVFEAFCHTDEPIVMDMDARKDVTHNDEGEFDTDAHRKIPVPGTMLSRFARRVCVTEESGDGLTTFKFNVRKSNKVGSGRETKRWSLHRLHMIAMEHHGLGLRNNSLVREFLELEDGQSFEDHPQFRWDARDAAYAERRLKHFEKKGWVGVCFAKWSDIDHCAGRSKAWMNCPLFCIHCSHSWNQCMSYLRILFGDWGWGLAPKKYGSGND